MIQGPNNVMMLKDEICCGISSESLEKQKCSCFSCDVTNPQPTLSHQDKKLSCVQGRTDTPWHVRHECRSLDHLQHGQGAKHQCRSCWEQLKREKGGFSCCIKK